MQHSTQTLALGACCFWCSESVYLQVRGVLAVESGYSNGHLPNPTYDDVCTGTSGHNEVVKLEFDPSVISVREVLEIFFVIHDPTTLNRQGHDVGTQYRSGIYCTTPRGLPPKFLCPQPHAGLLRGGGRTQGGQVPQDLCATGKRLGAQEPWASEGAGRSP